MTALTTTWVRELRDGLGRESVLTDPEVTAYARDQAAPRRAPRGTGAVGALARS